MVLIFSAYPGNRLRYTLRFLFEAVVGVKWELTKDKEVFEAYKGPKINYSAIQELSGLRIHPSGLLRQKGIKEVGVTAATWDELPAIMPTKGDLSFDLFGASFYLLSRYEEYQPHRSDHYGRFLAEESVAFQHGFLGRPMIDEWMMKLKKEWLSQFEIEIRERKYTFTATIDVDSAYAYKHKGLMRTLGGMAKDIVGGEFRNLKERLLCVFTNKHDPFDTYDELHAHHQKFGTKAIFFFLLADYGLNDKGVSYKSKPLQQLIRRLGDYYRIGIHPGFQSNLDPNRLKEETERLAGIMRKEVLLSRQHFLILNFPETYRRLIDEGVREDHTMGYASQTGFRASTCTPFNFFDIERDLETKLLIHPFAAMDATLSRYLALTPEKGQEQIGLLADQVRNVNGQMVILWHNESLSEKWEWIGWRKVYLRAIEQCAE
jgi:hypothetical protein